MVRRGWRRPGACRLSRVDPLASRGASISVSCLSTTRRAPRAARSLSTTRT